MGIRRPHWRKMSWVILAWNALMVIWIIVGLAAAHNTANCGSLSQQACQDATNVGAGIGVMALVFLWLVVDVLLAIIWLVTKPRGQRDCLVCGNVVKRGLTTCKACGYDFAKGTSAPR